MNPRRESSALPNIWRRMVKVNTFGSFRARLAYA